MSSNLPVSADPVEAPRDREKAVAAAFLRILGASQADAAGAAGVGERTLRGWEGCSWWPDVLADASRRWLDGLAAKARKGLEDAVQVDGRLALSVLERMEPALAPPKLRAQIETLDMKELSDEQLARIAAGEDPAHVLGG
ncbi:MAG: hypothetical protein WD960_07995 [Gemmatimonadota bacterium]